MVHLLFVALSFVLVVIGQKMLLVSMMRLRGWTLRRSLQLLGLVLPLSVVILFFLTMLPFLLSSEAYHGMVHNIDYEWLLEILGMTVVTLPLLLTLIFNLIRVVWLYSRSLRHTWQAPRELELRYENKGRGSFLKHTPKLRLWYSSRPFAYNLPALLPGAAGLIVISTGIVEQLDSEELEAVLRHEEAHLVRRDFWVIWLATWLTDTFFYLPMGQQFCKLLKAEQELACDERVAKAGGTSQALALADALLKVWEVLSTTLPRSKKLFSVCDFKAPSLTSQTDVSLTEQRVVRLIEIGSVADTGKDLVFSSSWLKTLGFLTGSVGLWLAGLEMVHSILSPYGCVIPLPFALL